MVMDTRKKPPVTSEQLKAATVFYVSWMARIFVGKKRGKAPVSWRELGRISGVTFSHLYAIAKRYKETRKVLTIEIETVAGIAHAYETINRQQRIQALKASLDPKPKRKSPRAKPRKKRKAKPVTKRPRRSAPRHDPGVRSRPKGGLGGDAGS